MFYGTCDGWSEWIMDHFVFIIVFVKFDTVHSFPKETHFFWSWSVFKIDMTLFQSQKGVIANDEQIKVVFLFGKSLLSFIQGQHREWNAPFSTIPSLQVEAGVNIQDRHDLIEAINVRLSSPIFLQDNRK